MGTIPSHKDLAGGASNSLNNKFGNSLEDAKLGTLGAGRWMYGHGELDRTVLRWRTEFISAEIFGGNQLLDVS